MAGPRTGASGCWLKIAGALQLPQAAPEVLVRCDTHTYLCVAVGLGGDETHPDGELPDGVSGEEELAER